MVVVELVEVEVGEVVVEDAAVVEGAAVVKETPSGVHWE